MQDSIHEDATLYSLGLLSPDQAAAFEDRISGDPALARLVRELAELSGAVLISEARQINLRPSPLVKARVLSRIEFAVQYPRSVTLAMLEAHLPPPKPGEAVAFADREGILDWVSPAFSELCGYSLEEMRGLRAGTRLRGALSQQEAKSRLRNAVEHRVPVVQRIVNYRKDGVPYWVEIDLHPVSAGFVALERGLGLAV